MLIDSHCHLDFPDFTERMDEVMENAAKNGVQQMITISTRVRQVEKLINIADHWRNVFFTIGTHPHNADEERDIKTEELLEIATHQKCVGLGEAGLDYYYNHSSADNQKRGFEVHIEAAQESKLPLVIHSRDAEKDTINILQKYMAQKEFKPLLHCFSASSWMADAALELGAYISFSGIATYKSAKEILEVASRVPCDKYLIETDAPYLAPVPMRGKKNEPAYVLHTAEHIAKAREIELEQLALETKTNTLRLFNKMPDLDEVR